MENIKSAYNAEDADSFTADFASVMFTSGFTKEAYLDTIKTLKVALGDWEEEVYLGLKDGAYTWRATFTDGKAKVVVVLSSDGKVTGLWFM